jgi:hypothetical protein
MGDNWTKTAQYLIKYKQKLWQKIDERDVKKESEDEIKM